MKDTRAADLISFLAIADHLNFSRAAVALGVSPSALSHTLRILEERLEVRLVNRTTRSVALTEAGERLYTRLKPAFRDIDDALDDLNAFRGKPAGRLRINAGLSAAQLAVLPLVQRFIAAYPDIAVELVSDDSLIDMVSSGFDAGVRFGETIATDMIAVPLMPQVRSIIVAAPSLLERFPAPKKPQDLKALPCIGQRFPSGAMYHWELERGGVSLEIRAENWPLILGDMGLCIDAARGGSGLAFVFEGLVQEDLAAGRLVRVLENWCPYFPGLYLYYPSRRQLPSALKAFVEFVKQAH